ncbi:NB-ARC domain-containing protein [Umezawaea endophytica]|uniref:NB-ARC domain-containing protein n=1 Tax=Umezawaea endophytica TaxID=1654476 RepID=A0A9X2VPD3_9PSEU|nr:NB-ARC domain-containing protein [Umezawaea endophytica]MCS7480370.1 NB-ARC domain-containing protein [Umezawaea endophytica]
MRAASEPTNGSPEFGTRNLIGHVTGTSVQAGTVHGGVHVHIASAVPPVPAKPSRRGLPRRIDLVGRDAELESGVVMLTDPDQRHVLFVHGTPGVGKTAFAVALGWSVADRFADGCVFVEVSERGDLVADLLSALAPGERLPGERDQRIAALSALASRLDVLVVLDNVRDEDSLGEVLALGGRLAVLCTSRNRLTGLGDQDVSFLELDSLPVGDSSRLAVSIAERLTPQQSVELAEVCGGLPIALCVASARINRTASLDVDRYLKDLAHPDHGLEELRAGARSVERIIEYSHRELTSGQTALFATLGMLPTRP